MIIFIKVQTDDFQKICDLFAFFFRKHYKFKLYFHIEGHAKHYDNSNNKINSLFKVTFQVAGRSLSKVYEV